MEAILVCCNNNDNDYDDDDDEEYSLRKLSCLFVEAAGLYASLSFTSSSFSSSYFLRAYSSYSNMIGRGKCTPHVDLFVYFNY